MNDLLSEPRAIATVLTGLFSLAAAVAAIWLNVRLAKIKIEIDRQANSINWLRTSTENRLREAQLLSDDAYRASESLFRELSLLRQDASVFLATLELIDQRIDVTQEQRMAAVTAAKRISLIIPPASNLGEDLDTQLQTGILCIFGAERDDMMSSHLRNLKLSLWNLSNEKDKRIQAMLKMQLHSS